jgi:hypothetical protein
VAGGHEWHHQHKQQHADDVEVATQLGAQRQHTQSTAVQQGTKQDAAAINAKILRGVINTSAAEINSSVGATLVQAEAAAVVGNSQACRHV